MGTLTCDCSNSPCQTLQAPDRLLEDFPTSLARRVQKATHDGACSTSSLGITRGPSGLSIWDQAVTMAVGASTPYLGSCSLATRVRYGLQKRLTMTLAEVSTAAFLPSVSEINPEGPGIEYIRTLVPKAIKGMVVGTVVLEYWVLGPCGKRMFHHPGLLRTNELRSAQGGSSLRRWIQTTKALPIPHLPCTNPKRLWTMLGWIRGCPWDLVRTYN